VPAVKQSVPVNNQAPAVARARRQREPQWDQVRAESLSAQIVSQVRSALFQRELRPGDFLGTEASLAERFGVSRMASRDALRSLAASGIVTVKQGAKGGAWISQGAVDHLGDALAIQMTLLNVTTGDVMELQTGMEAVAAELAAERATDEEIAALKTHLAALVAASDSPKKYASLAFDLHEHVVLMAANEALLAQFRGVRQLMEPVIVANSTAHYVKSSLPAHRKLVTLIAQRDSLGAWNHAHERMREARKNQRNHATPANKAG
jgi:GntR family transcriptional regulator, transcriptional repressor for pyruvate dehydrogenase complex